MIVGIMLTLVRAAAVTNGRVSKSSPAKKKTTKVVKEEKKGEEEEDIFAGVDFGGDSGDLGMNGDAFTL